MHREKGPFVALSGRRRNRTAQRRSEDPGPKPAEILAERGRLPYLRVEVGESKRKSRTIVRRNMKKTRWIVFAVVVAALLSVGLPQSPTSTALAQSSNPPSSYTTYIPVCYDNVNGAVRFFSPWAVKQGDPNCTPPDPWAIYGPYDGVACVSGGRFDCRNNEFYLQIALVVAH